MTVASLPRPVGRLDGSVRTSRRTGDILRCLSFDAMLRKTRDALRAGKQVQNDFLDEVRRKTLRGIRNLRVAFDYPVRVVDGWNRWSVRG